MENWLLLQIFIMCSPTAAVRLWMPLLEEHSYHLPLLKPTLVEKMASNQGWNEERTQTCKRGGGMHQLKEVDMLNAKMDLLMKRLNDRACDKNEVMHINDSRMICG